MSPYLTALFLAGVLTVLFSPVFRFVQRYVKRKSTASAVTVLFVLVAILAPLTLIGLLMFQEVISLYSTLNDNNIGIQVVNVWIEQFQSLVQHFIPTFVVQSNVYDYLDALLQWFAQHLNQFFSSIITFLFDIFLIIIAMFFFYRDGDKLKAFALKWSPLADQYDESIISRLESAVSSVVKGALASAVLQGFLVGIGFLIFDIPNPVLWGTIGTVAALIPALGTALITFPAVIFLFAFGHGFAALGLFFWAVVCVGLSDNLLHPFIVNRGVHIHPFLILLSVFGGLVYFGPIGFIAGPVLFAFFFALLDIYPLIIKGRSIEGKI
jgi:predicted PurR-regulated permease PerM